MLSGAEEAHIRRAPLIVVLRWEKCNVGLAFLPL